MLQLLRKKNKMTSITSNEFRLLNCITSRDNYKSLGHETGMNKTSICFALKGLVDKGLIIKIPESSAGSPISLKLTRFGAKVKRVLSQIKV